MNKIKQKNLNDEILKIKTVFDNNYGIFKELFFLGTLRNDKISIFYH